MAKLFPKGSRVIFTPTGEPGTVTEDVVHGLRTVELDKNGHVARALVVELAKIGSDKTIIISVRGGCVQDVEGLPRGWQYLLLDYDNIEAGEEGQS